MKKHKILRTIIELVVLFGLVFLLRIFIFNPVEVLGNSMEPTYHESDRLWQMTFVEPSRFDNVTFISPRNGKMLVKRVIGLPGDTIRYENDQLYINDKAYDEDYLDEFKVDMPDGEPLTPDFSLETLTATQTSTVTEGKYFVLGDNRQIADDSRYFGFVDQDDIKGVIFFRFFPLNKIGLQ
ncbi:signal peptidase I [Enterococcus sp. CWB-B31]|uniref:signal peptidase I n=1 Tax=Enterococcus sp. CWB-B31 TaxID=2885159 RepID=UPI001E2D3877|nr:signal peptidase I [Enterococcus sp. CWB-B31]MCB5953631.1 signal peptidase I [Enterococcus sp. CWB-B31]